MAVELALNHNLLLLGIVADPWYPILLDLDHVMSHRFHVYGDNSSPISGKLLADDRSSTSCKIGIPLRGNGEIDRFIFSDHLPLRWVGGLYQEIKSVIDQH